MSTYVCSLKTVSRYAVKLKLFAARPFVVTRCNSACLELDVLLLLLYCNIAVLIKLHTMQSVINYVQARTSKRITLAHLAAQLAAQTTMDITDNKDEAYAYEHVYDHVFTGLVRALHDASSTGTAEHCEAAAAQIADLVVLYCGEEVRNTMHEQMLTVLRTQLH
jgi:hypothetical protein